MAPQTLGTAFRFNDPAGVVVFDDENLCDNDVAVEVEEKVVVFVVVDDDDDDPQRPNDVSRVIAARAATQRVRI